MIKKSYATIGLVDLINWFTNDKEGQKALKVLNDNNIKYNKPVLTAHQMAVSFLQSREDEKLAKELLQFKYSFDYDDEKDNSIAVDFTGTAENHFQFRIYETDKGEKIDHDDPMFRPDIEVTDFNNVITYEVKSIYLKEHEGLIGAIKKAMKSRNLHKADYLMIIVHDESHQLSAIEIELSQVRFRGEWITVPIINNVWDFDDFAIQTAFKKIDYQFMSY